MVGFDSDESISTDLFSFILIIWIIPVKLLKHANTLRIVQNHHVNPLSAQVFFCTVVILVFGDDHFRYLEEYDGARAHFTGEGEV